MMKITYLINTNEPEQTNASITNTNNTPAPAHNSNYYFCPCCNISDPKLNAEKFTNKNRCRATTHEDQIIKFHCGECAKDMAVQTRSQHNKKYHPNTNLAIPKISDTKEENEKSEIKLVDQTLTPTQTEMIAPAQTNVAITNANPTSAPAHNSNYYFCPCCNITDPKLNAAKFTRENRCRATTHEEQIIKFHCGECDLDMSAQSRSRHNKRVHPNTDVSIEKNVNGNYYFCPCCNITDPNLNAAKFTRENRCRATTHPEQIIKFHCGECDLDMSVQSRSPHNKKAHPFVPASDLDLSNISTQDPISSSIMDTKVAPQLQESKEEEIAQEQKRRKFLDSDDIKKPSEILQIVETSRTNAVINNPLTFFKDTRESAKVAACDAKNDRAAVSEQADSALEKGAEEAKTKKIKKERGEQHQNQRQITNRKEIAKESLAAEIHVPSEENKDAPQASLDETTDIEVEEAEPIRDRTANVTKFDESIVPEIKQDERLRLESKPLDQKTLQQTDTMLLQTSPVTRLVTLLNVDKAQVAQVKENETERFVGQTKKIEREVESGKRKYSITSIADYLDISKALKIDEFAQANNALSSKNRKNFPEIIELLSSAYKRALGKDKSVAFVIACYLNHAIEMAANEKRFAADKQKKLAYGKFTAAKGNPGIFNTTVKEESEVVIRSNTDRLSHLFKDAGQNFEKDEPVTKRFILQAMVNARIMVEKLQPKQVVAYVEKMLDALTRDQDIALKPSI